MRIQAAHAKNGPMHQKPPDAPAVTVTAVFTPAHGPDRQMEKQPLASIMQAFPCFLAPPSPHDVMARTPESSPRATASRELELHRVVRRLARAANIPLPPTALERRATQRPIQARG